MVEIIMRRSFAWSISVGLGVSLTRICGIEVKLQVVVQRQNNLGLRIYFTVGVTDNNRSTVQDIIVMQKQRVSGAGVLFHGKCLLRFVDKGSVTSMRWNKLNGDVWNNVCKKRNVKTIKLLKPTVL